MAGILAAVAADAASPGCPGWISPLGCAEVLGPLRDWPLAVRIRAHETDLTAVAAEVRAAPGGRTAPIRRTVGGFSILHAWVREEGVSLALCRSPDGEMGLFCADAGAPAPGRPTFMPEGRAWSTYRRVAGRWWFYDWENP